MDTRIHFSLLGPVQGTYAGQALQLGSARQCALLAVLLCRLNVVVSASELLDGVWGDRPPASGRKLIPTYVYRLRRAMPVDSGAEIDRLQGGYLLRAAPESVDLTLFSAAEQQARAHRERGDFELARQSLDHAATLWRGEPFAGLPGPTLAIERLRLREQWLSVLEQRLELDLVQGRELRAISELRVLRAEHPLHERFATLLMGALYRTGRQADSLAVYRKTESELDAELGTRPGRGLDALHQAVLNGDDGAVDRLCGIPAPAEITHSAESVEVIEDREGRSGEGAAAGADTAADPEEPVATRREYVPRCDLPAPPARLFGRERELAAVIADPAESDAPMLLLDGMPGVGKTAFLLRAAQELAPHYPDGQLYLDLHAHTSGRSPLSAAEALQSLLAAVGTPAAELPPSVDERAALWRSRVAGRRVLLVFDDAADAEQVWPLLPGPNSGAVLLAGRPKLLALPARRVLSLAPLDGESSRRLLGNVLGESRLAGEPSATSALVAACAGLPLALTAAAARLRHDPGCAVSELVAGIARPGGLSSALSTGKQDVVSAITASCDNLGPAARATLRQCVNTRSHKVSGADGQVLRELLEANLLSRSTAGTVIAHPLVARAVTEHDAAAIPDGGPGSPVANAGYAVLEARGTAASTDPGGLRPLGGSGGEVTMLGAARMGGRAPHDASGLFLDESGVG